MAWLVSAAFKLKKRLEIRSSIKLENSSASTVFLKFGTSVLDVISSIFFLLFWMASLKAGRKSAVLILEKGALL